MNPILPPPQEGIAKHLRPQRAPLSVQVQRVAHQDAGEKKLPHTHVGGRAQQDSFAPREEEEVGGELVVDGLGEGPVGRRRYVRGEAGEVEGGGGEGDVGAEEGAQGFEVEEYEAVGEGEVGGRHHGGGCVCGDFG